MKTLTKKKVRKFGILPNQDCYFCLTKDYGKTYAVHGGGGLPGLLVFLSMEKAQKFVKDMREHINIKESPVHVWKWDIARIALKEAKGKVCLRRAGSIPGTNDLLVFQEWKRV